MQQAKHIVFVETNSSGIIGLETALSLGHKVSFIFSESNKALYNFEKMASLFSRLTNVICCDDTFNSEALWRSATKLNEREKIDAIVTVLEYCIEATALVSEKLRLPGMSVHIASRARNKWEVRKLLSNAGLATCRSFQADDLNSLKNGLEGISFPVVTKPSRGAASFFVRVCENEEEVVDAWNELSSSKSQVVGGLDSVISEALLVEEYLSGRMISAEVGLSKGQFLLFTIGERKRAQHNEVIELGTTMPAPLSSQEWSAVEAYSKGVLEALELGSGIFHLEIMLTDNGPILIEMNPRLMGGSLPKVYNFAYRTNIYERLIEAHLGEPFGRVPPLPSDSVTSRIFGAIQEGKLNDTFNLAWTKDFGENDLQYDLYCKPSSPVKLLSSNHDYLGALRLRAANPQESRRIADLVIERFESALGTKLAK